MKLQVPYETTEKVGQYLEIDVDEKNLLKEFVITEPKPVNDVANVLLNYLENPIECESLSKKLTNNIKKVCIITENQFRQAPIKEIISLLLKKYFQPRNIETNIIIGCGKVPPLTKDEVEDKLGKDALTFASDIVSNDVTKPENYIFKGITTHGTPLWIHKKVVESDLILSISTTQATLWGYGGSGMIIPAVSGNETIEINHIMSLAPDCKPGNNQCHMQQDKYEAAEIAGIFMGIN
ncbi:MAG: lactate racemase domain-containing protein, partial [Thermoplasmata archaeon]